MKKAAAYAALNYIPEQGIIGIGTGSTTNYFIDVLASRKHLLEGTVASSQATAERLKAHGIPVFDLNAVGHLSIYIDGADEVDPYLRLIKGGGGALTREKIIATVAEQFICIADQSKQVNRLGEFPIAIEVIPMARSYVGRQLVNLGGNPKYREGFITDNGNIIIDAYQLDTSDPVKLEYLLNNITGVVCHGLFAKRTADKLLLSTEAGVHLIEPKVEFL